MPTYFVVEYHTVSCTYKVEASNPEDALDRYQDEGEAQGEEALGCDECIVYNQDWVEM